MKNKNTNPHAGSSFEDFLKETGIFEEVKAAAIKQLIALQLRDEMEKKNLTHKAMAERMGTSRSQLRRLLDPKNVSVTLLTLEKAASALGKDLEISLK
jgi:antitoxin HicB